MDPTMLAAVDLKYKRLWTEYKLTLTSLYFSDKPISGNGSLFTWHGGGDIKGSEQDPILAFLQTPRLSPELEPYLRD